MPQREPVSDEDLLRHAAEGNSGILAELVERHGDRLWRLFLRLAASANEADDLLQETFVRLLRSHRTFAGRASPATWLYSVALNVFREWLRKQKSERRLKAVIQAGADGRAAGDRLKQQTRAEAVRKAVEGLAENQRTAMILSRYEGLSYEQIAEVEGCSVDAVKQRVRRAMVRLRRELRGPDEL